MVQDEWDWGRQWWSGELGGKGKRSCGGGSEGLEGLLRGLKLSEEMSKVKAARRTEGGDGDQATQAVGKLFASKAGYVEGIAQTLGRIWCPG